MCIKESLRLFPPVIALGREMSQNVTFDGHVMPKGVSVSMIKTSKSSYLAISLTNYCRGIFL